ncbi:MAG: M23 family metallopeptidase [Balneolaceae bacterium]
MQKTTRTLSLLMGILFLLVVEEGMAQLWRFSGGYAVQQSEFQSIRHPEYDGRIAPVMKGMMHLQAERYLLYRFYAAVSVNLLLHQQETVFLGGPVDFEQADVGVNLGMQWSRFGVYGGVQTGRLWNLSWRGTDPGGMDVSLRSSAGEPGAFWTTGWKAGGTYLLLPWVRLFGEAVNHHALSGRLTAPDRAGHATHVSQGEFGGWSYRIGLTLSIPWHSNRRARRVQARGSLPTSMEMGGVRLRSPLEESTEVISRFGRRWGRLHQGVDLRAGRGTTVVSAEDGIVVQARTSSGYGRMVLVQHANGYQTRYAHLQRIRVRSGQTVRQGERVGTAGDSGTTTGVHLHFEVLKDGRSVDPETMIRFD